MAWRIEWSPAAAFEAEAEAAKYALKRDGLAPIGEVTKKAEPKRGNFLTRDELRVVLAHIEKLAPQWYAAVLLDVFVGLRWGELSALRWSDIDDQRGLIRVERGNYEGRVVGSTKTGNEEVPNAKVVPLLPEVAEVLRARRQEMVAAQHPGLVEGWVFPTERGTLYKGHPLRKVLEDALAACKIDRRVTPHGLRHTANNELRRVANGEVVRAIIGHATEAMTHHYSHVGEDEKREAVARVFAIVKGDERVVSGVVAKSSTTHETTHQTETVGGATQI